MYRVSDVLRRIYHELVRRRTTVRVIRADEAKLDIVPIFLTGVFRSGTTLVRYIVDSHSRICCPPESNFLRAFEPLLGDRDFREGLRSMGFDEEHVLSRIRDFAVYAFANYSRTAGKPRWADKTPAYVTCLDFVDRLFPMAQHLMIYRHAFDVAHSITNNGVHLPDYLTPFSSPGRDPRVAAAAYWGHCTDLMMQFQAARADRCHPIQYERLCREPEPVLRAAFAFLNEPWEPAVMEYWKFPHDRGFEDGRAGATRGFAISEGNYRAWPADVLDEAQRIAGPMLDRAGYTVDRTPATATATG